MGDNLLGEFIKECRKIMGFSMRELAATAGISPSQLSKIERGLSKPTEDTLNQLAFALKVDRYELFVLAGIINEEIKEEIALSLPVIFDKLIPKQTEIAMRETAAASYEPLEGIIETAITREHPDMSAEDIAFIVREMLAAQRLALKRLSKRRRQPRLI